MTDSLPQTTSLRDQPRYDCRDAYVKTLSELADADHRIVGVVNDSVGSSKLDAFKKAFPDRLINVGIAEQDMVGVAAGLANGGRIPFVSAASCFLTARALEQIKADTAKLNSIHEEAKQMLTEAESRLEMIEAAGSRGGSLADTEVALKKLAARASQLPLALEAARIQEEAVMELETSDRLAEKIKEAELEELPSQKTPPV